MNLPEYNTTNCESYDEFWGSENDNRFACKICGEPWPNKVRIYPDHTRVYRAYAILQRLEHELLGDQFNALSVTLKLSEEGII